MWLTTLNWLKDNQIGDLTGVAGIIISVVGFIATLIGVAKSKNAATRAAEAAKSTRDSIRMIDAIVDFSATIASLEEIRRLQRQSAWSVLPERYSAIRKLLIAHRHAIGNLSDHQKERIQDAIANFRSIELRLDRAPSGPSQSVAVRINKIVSEQIDELLLILSELKAMNDRGLS